MTCGGWSGKTTANALSCSVRPWRRDWYILCRVTPRPMVVLNSLFFFSSPFSPHSTIFHSWSYGVGTMGALVYFSMPWGNVRTWKHNHVQQMVSRMIIGIQFIQASFYTTASFYATAILSISRLFVLPLTHWQESSHCFWPLTVGEVKVYGNIRMWLMKVSMGEKNSVSISCLSRKLHMPLNPIFRSFSC